VAATEKTPAYLGLEFRWHDATQKQKSLHVERVAIPGPAHRAGIQPGDLITHIGSVPVGFGDELDFLLFMRDRAPGERLVLTVIRAGRSTKRVAVLAALPPAARLRWEENFKLAQRRRAAARQRR
jgi:S1-C subfamily serine protease